MKSFSTHIKRRALHVSVATLMLSSMGVAYAGTDAGQLISNTATVSYSVNSVPQTDVNSPAATFVVDRKIDVNITATGVTTQPNTNDVVTRFVVTNEGNAADSFTLHYNYVSGVDISTSLRMYLDVNTNGVYDAGTDTLVANDSVVAFAKDQVRQYLILGNIPNTATNGQSSVVNLTATTTTAATPPGPDNPNAVEVVYAEGSGPTYDGALSATATYAIQSAALSVNKTAQVVLDPTGATAPNAKAIPGAYVRYTITVTNNGSVNATSVALSDAIPANTTYRPGTITLGGVAQTDVASDDSGTFTGTAVNVTVGTVNSGGGSATVTFDVEIN